VQSGGEVHKEGYRVMRAIEISIETVVERAYLAGYGKVLDFLILSLLF